MNTDKTEHSISVQGDGEVYVTPDTLILSFRVEETAPTTAEAQKNANEKIDQVKEIIKQYDVDATDIKTTNVNVYEQYDWRESGRTSL
ncbi:SIMPL domain-containing protein [bacterium]|nr:SIMPL domain-containing protein [bacterium]